MLSKKQFGLIQVVCGLAAEEIIIKSGIPAQSFMVLMQSDGSRDHRDPSKLISESTYRRLAQTLGLEPGMSGLRTGAVIEWRMDRKQRARWEEAVRVIRHDLLSDNVDMTVVTAPAPSLFSKKQIMVYLHDVDKDVKIVITGADQGTVRFLRALKTIDENPASSMDIAEFKLTQALLAHGVYRSAQFQIVFGGRRVKYTWQDVMAAAKEFNFTTDALIELMVSTVQRAEQPERTEGDRVLLDPASVEARPSLRVAGG